MNPNPQPLTPNPWPLNPPPSTLHAEGGSGKATVTRHDSRQHGGRAAVGGGARRRGRATAVHRRLQPHQEAGVHVPRGGGGGGL